MVLIVPAIRTQDFPAGTHVLAFPLQMCSSRLLEVSCEEVLSLWGKTKSSCFWQIEMERCQCLPLNSKFARNSVPVKTKPFNRRTVISCNQLFKVLSTGTNTCPQPWPPLTNGLVDDVLLELSSAFKFLQGSVATLFRWSWKILPYFVANLSKTLHINLYQDRSSIVEVMTKKLVCF